MLDKIIILISFILHWYKGIETNGWIKLTLSLTWWLEENLSAYIKLFTGWHGSCIRNDTMEQDHKQWCYIKEKGLHQVTYTPAITKEDGDEIKRSEDIIVYVFHWKCHCSQHTYNSVMLFHYNTYKSTTSSVYITYHTHIHAEEIITVWHLTFQVTLAKHQATCASFQQRNA